MTNERFMRYYNPTDWFKYTNPNPTAKNKKTLVWDKADCAIRALAISAGIEWVDAYDYLSAKARRDYSVPNDGKCFRKWLIEGGAVWTFCKAESGRKRMTALDFAKAHPVGSWVITISNHECACVDGKLRDTWNCGEKAVVGYFDMAGFRI